VYAVATPDQAPRFYAVNLLDPQESWIEPREKIELADAVVAAEKEGVQRANMPLWPLLALVALVLVCVEWLAYNLKVRI